VPIALNYIYRQQVEQGSAQAQEVKDPISSALDKIN
jgi:hypothetical protein